MQVGAFGMETALLAAAGDPAGPTVAILAEYDALPDIGHGCGHNIIAASAVGAFLLAAQQVGRTGGQVVLLGTPAEENGAGKELLARAGAFQDVDAVLMIHPMAGRYDVAHFNSLGCRSVRARYHGRSAHASAAPHLGRNALDAAVSSCTGIAALRQHLRPVERIHGVIEDGGGAAPNVVPDHASCIYLVRSDTVPALMDLSDRVEAVLRAAALATGTEFDLQWDVAPAYLPVRGNAALAETYAAHARSLGRPLADDLPGPNPPGGSTDLGNVSVRVPAIHATVAACGPGVPMHSALFAQQAVSAEGDRAVADAAVMLAGAALDFLADGDLRDRVRAGYLCAVLMIGALAGTTLSGPLAQVSLHWPLWVTAAGLTIGFLLLMTDRAPAPERLLRHPMDGTGALLLAAGPAGLVLGIDKGANWGYGDGRTLGCLAFGLLVLAAWVVVELRAEHPLMDLRYLLRPRLVPTFLVGFLMYFAFLGSQVPNATFMSIPARLTGYGLGLSSAQVSLALVIPFAVMALTASGTARVARQWGYPRVVALGCVVFGIGAVARRDARVGVGRTGRTAGPVAGDGQRHTSWRGRGAALGRAAGDQPGGGLGRECRREGHRAARVRRRPGAAGPRPAGAGRGQRCCRTTAP